MLKDTNIKNFANGTIINYALDSLTKLKGNMLLSTLENYNIFSNNMKISTMFQQGLVECEKWSQK